MISNAWTSTQGHVLRYHPIKVSTIFCILALITTGLQNEAHSTTWYCDPVSGDTNNNNGQSVETAWGTLESVVDAGKFHGTIADGDTIKLLSGYHGHFNTEGIWTQYKQNSIGKTIEAYTGATPKLKKLTLKGCVRWTFRGLSISPSYAGSISNHDWFEFYSMVYGYLSSYITIENCDIFTIDDVSSWTLDDWSNKPYMGIVLTSHDHCTYRNNTIRNVARGIYVYGGSIAEGNTIDNFAEDGIRISGQNVIVQDNIITDEYWCNNIDNPGDVRHSDILQMPLGANCNNVTIRRNYGNSRTDPTRISVHGCQGMFFQPDYISGTIENNVLLVTNTMWGIGIKDGVRCENLKIVNNTIVRPINYGDWPDIHVYNFQTRSDVVIKNNIADSWSTGSGITADHNFDISNYDPLTEFVDYADGNVRLAAGSSFIDVASSTDAPSEDLDGNSRPQDQGYDVGAYEYILVNSDQAPNADAGSDQAVTDSNGNGSEQVTLDGSSSTDPDGTIVNYVWKEDGTQIATGVNPTVTLSVGQYTITLTVTDDDGLTDTDTVVITVNDSSTNQPPSANAGPDQTVIDSDSNGSEQITLNGSGSTDPDGTITSYVWAEGGTQIATGVNPTVTLSVGEHMIILTVTDNGGLTDTDTVTITINANGSAPPDDSDPPSVSIYSPQSGAVQVPVNNLITLHIADAGTGVDADTVTIRVDGDTVYTGDTAHYSSSNGDCRRTGTKADYTFTYQSSQMFEFEQKITVTVNAADVAGNVMPEYSYSFWTEMRSFGGNKQVSSGLDDLGCGAPATVRDSSGNIWVVWHAGPSGSRNIFFAKLTEGTANFGDTLQITGSSADACHPAIALGANDKLYVAWQDNRGGKWDIYVSTSADGITWSAEERITDPNYNQINPAMAIDSTSRAYIVWQDDRQGNQDIYIASSNDNFAAKIPLASGGSDQVEPAIAVASDNTIYVIWTDLSSGLGDIYGAASNNSWSNVAIVTNANGQSSPVIATEASGSILHLLWVDDSPNGSDIYYAETDGLPTGPLTGSSIIDDGSGADQLQPTIAVTGYTGNNLRVFSCWQDWRVVGSSTDTDLYLVRANSAGGTNVFVGDDSTNADQSQPAIGVDRYSHPYIVWTDSRSTNNQVYYAGSTVIDPQPVASQLVSASTGATVGTDPASITSVDDVSVVVPPGACSCDIKITISEIKNPPAFVVPCLSSYDFGPSGMVFGQPVTITIPYVVSDSQGSATPYWYNALSGALSQQGITDIQDIVISPTLHALSFKTTHFTAFYLLLGSAGAASSGGGGCALSTNGGGSIVEFLLPYISLALVMAVVKLRDKQSSKVRSISVS